jgi:Tfp pilus assembly pilus retraction ATPase PilT
MEYLHNLLKFALNMGASDIHVKPQAVATIRVSGELHPVQEVTPTNDQVQEMVKQMIPRHLEMRLEREKEVDFSYVAPGLGRFRVNVFYQRGQL